MNTIHYFKWIYEKFPWWKYDNTTVEWGRKLVACSSGHGAVCCRPYMNGQIEEKFRTGVPKWGQKGDSFETNDDKNKSKSGQNWDSKDTNKAKMGQGTEMGQMWDKRRTEVGQKVDNGQKWDKSRGTNIDNQHRKRCFLFTYCRQESATFSPHFHTTWGPPFRDSLYFPLVWKGFSCYSRPHSSVGNLRLLCEGGIEITWRGRFTLIHLLCVIVGNPAGPYPSPLC